MTATNTLAYYNLDLIFGVEVKSLPFEWSHEVGWSLAHKY
jgi:hypothetical protein